MADEYYQLTHTGEQIDDAIKKIDGLENCIEINTKNIKTNTDDITTLKGSVSSKDSQIQANKDNITTCLSRITTIENTTIKSLQSQINAHDENINNLKGVINNKVEQGIYDKAIEDLKSQNSQLQNNITAVRDDQDTKLGLIRDQVESNETNIQLLSNKIDNINTLVGNIEGLQQSVSSISQDYEEFKAGDFASTQTTANNALAATESLNEEFTSFYNDTFGPLSQEVHGDNGILNEIKTLKSQIAELQRKIDELTNSN